MSFRINCELCGIWIDAERRSKQYCSSCRPKAVVLGNVVKALNEASNHDNLAINDIVNQEVAVDTEALALLIPALAGENRLGVMTILNIALKEYGMIAYNGDQFEVVPWRDRPGVVLVPDPATIERDTGVRGGLENVTSSQILEAVRRRTGIGWPQEGHTVPEVDPRTIIGPRGPAPRDGYGRTRRH